MGIRCFGVLARGAAAALRPAAVVVAATLLAIGAAGAQDIQNPAVPFTNPAATTINSITFNDGGTHNAGGVAAVTNNGQINSDTTFPSSIAITNSTTVLGSIVNNGGVTAASGGNGVFISGSSVTGDIVNGATGSMAASATNPFPNIFVGSGASLNSGSGGTGSIINNGTLSGNGGNAINVTSGAIAGSITNTNTISIGGSGSVGIVVGAGTSVGNGVSNSGSITTNGTNALFFNIGIEAGPGAGFAVTGGISNTGTITDTFGRSFQGIRTQDQNSTFVGDIHNGGNITFNGTNGATVIDAFGINFTGKLQAGGGGTGAITNSGTITITAPATNSGSAVGISLNRGAALVPGGITNTGTITVSASGSFNFAAAIDLTGFIGANTVAPAVTVNQNAGSLNGPFAVVMSNVNADVLNINGGAVNGAISGGLPTTLNVTGGTLVGNVTGVGTFAVNRSDAFSYGSVFSGGGQLQQLGTGTTTLSGANTYTGTTSVNAGILRAGATNTFSAASAFTVLAGATLDLNGFNNTIGSLAGAGPVTLGAGTLTTGGNNTSTLFSGAISGTGGLTMVGTGVFTLSGANNYGGATNVNAGTLRAGATGTFAPGSAFTVAAGATLDLNGLNQVIGSLAGGGAVTLGAGTLTTGGNDTSTNFSGGITGGGALIKVGNGTFTLSGTNGYTGPTSVDAGDLNVTGVLASAVTVNANAVLSGNGTVGALTVASGGTAAPGSLGTLTVTGNATFNAGSFYQVTTNAAGQSDRIVASTATIAGGTVQVVPIIGPYGRTTTYTILHTTGGPVTGQFANVTSTLAFLAPALSYPDPNDVVLTLTRNSTSFASVAQTFNQRAVANGLDASPFGSALVQAVLPLTSSQALTAFDALSGEIHASLRATIIDDSRFARDALLGRMRQLPFAADVGALSPLFSGGPMVAYAGAGPVLSYADATLARLDRRRRELPIKALPAAPVEDHGVVFWAQAVGARGDIDGDGNAADTGHTLGGFFTGVDRRFGDVRAGIAAGYTDASVSVNARASSADVATGHLAGYAGTSFGHWNLRTGVDLAWNSISTNRAIVFPGFADATRARYGAGEAQLFGELGYAMRFGRIAAEPFAGLAWVHLRADGFTEAGGAAALAGAAGSEDVGYTTLGMRAATTRLLPNGMSVTPRASVAWQHAFGDVTPTAALLFQSTGAGFTVAGVPIARDSAAVDAGADLRLNPRALLGISYLGEFAGSARNHAVRANFLWKL